MNCGKLGHEALAEAHNLHVGLTLGVKVGTALAAADGQTGQGILEYLLEAEELDDALINRGMEAQTALVGSDGAVELNAEAAVYSDVALVVNPRNAELDDSFRLDDAFEDAHLDIFGMLFDDRLEGFENLCHCLMKFRLIWIALFDCFHEICEILILKSHFNLSPFAR